jgi:2,3-bisphosphoglycerate-independent phosphoglycerate mutase
VEAGKKRGFRFVIIADHGNADLARNPDGSPHTAHTTNPVPLFVIAPGVTSVRDGILADVAPTVLGLMGIPQPPEMTGRSLVVQG